MNYLEIQMSVLPQEDYVMDVLASYLGEIGFESFEQTESGMIAYVQHDLFDRDVFESLCRNFPYSTDIQYEIVDIEQVNWNEEWEKHYFEPIIIGEECVIHSTFHTDIPVVKYDIVIDPKMSFGTGHHETTSLMIEELLKMTLQGKSVLDMGCGTAVLAILASMRGASRVTAIDIDPWCVENSAENIVKNHVADIEIVLGGAEQLSGRQFEIILANINRNILLADMQKYSTALSAGGVLYISGFYTEDIPVLITEANLQGLSFVDTHQKNNWALLQLVKG